MFTALEELLISYAEVVPLPLFAALSSFVEEIVAPIPSGPVMLVMGSIASVQGYGYLGLAGVMMMAVLGKLAGALAVYAIADKAEDVFSGRFAKLLGITHEQIEAFGKKLGRGWKDYVLLTMLRALPFVPSAVISAGSGVLKIDMKLYVIATIIGSILRDSFYLYLGYLGFQGAERLLEQFSAIESVLLAVTLGGLFIAFATYLYLRHRRARRKGTLETSKDSKEG